MQAVGQFDEYDPDIVGHGQQHFADVFGFRAWELVKGSVLNLVTPETMCRTSCPNMHSISSGRGMGVFNDIMQQPGGDADRIQFHISQNTGHFQRVGQVGFSGQPDLAVMHLGAE